MSMYSINCPIREDTLSMYQITLFKNTSEKLKKITPKNRPLVTIEGPLIALQ